jgi:hypothetical protein
MKMVDVVIGAAKKYRCASGFTKTELVDLVNFLRDVAEEMEYE